MWNVVMCHVCSQAAGGLFAANPMSLGSKLAPLPLAALASLRNPLYAAVQAPTGGGNAAAVNLAALQTLLQAQMQQNASLGLGSNMAAAAAALSQPTSNQ